MSVEIPNGAVASCIFRWSFGFHLDTADNFIAKVNQELIGDGLTIAQSSVDFGSGLAFSLGGSDFTGTVQVINQSGQELDDNDLQAQMADAVAQAGGTQISFGVTGVTGGESGTNTGTGKATVTALGGSVAATASKTHQCGDPTWSFFDDPGQYLSCLSTKGLTTVGLIAIGLLVGIVLIVGGQKTGRLSI